MSLGGAITTGFSGALPSFSFASACCSSPAPARPTAFTLYLLRLTYLHVSNGV